MLDDDSVFILPPCPFCGNHQLSIEAGIDTDFIFCTEDSCVMYEVRVPLIEWCSGSITFNDEY